MKQQQKNLVILKGLNRVGKEGWKGMKLNISYIGNFNDKMFGIANKKITPQDIVHYNYAHFTNEKLNAINQIKFSKKNFKELRLSNNINSRNRIGLFEEIMRNQIIPEYVHSQLYPRQELPFLSINNYTTTKSKEYHSGKFYSLSCDTHLNKSKMHLPHKTKRYKTKRIDIDNTNRVSKTHHFDRSISTFVSINTHLNHNHNHKHLIMKK